MARQYTQEELETLHQVLFEILGEIVRVCDLLDIKYFVQGGSAMGIYYEHDIMAWDDDIDVGMTRVNYNRFLKEAPTLLKKEYFLAWFKTDPHSPFYFAKLRKNNTLFLEDSCKNIKMHHGIYVDIFPYDNVPDDSKKEKRHRKLCNRLNDCFAGKDVWTWKYWGKCELENPNKKGFLDCLFTRVVDIIIPKSVIYQLLCKVQSHYNNINCQFCSIVMTSVDQIDINCIQNPQKAQFGPLEVVTVGDLDTYLHHHYGKNIQRIPPKEKQVNHAPLKVSFDTSKEEVNQ
jgi:lipopolysaccharide cholinephosphotransferase